MTLAAARRRSLLVRVLRFIFILIAIAIIGTVIAYIIASTNQPVPVLPQAQETSVNEDEMVIVSPKFTGFDDSSRPYEVNADTATRQTNGADVTDLVNPSLNTDPNNNSGANITAKRGQYDATGRILTLDENVTLKTSAGFEYTTPNATILIGEDQISGNEGVEGVGQMGAIKADEFEIIDGGERIVFTGRVSTRINVGEQKTKNKKEDE